MARSRGTQGGPGSAVVGARRYGTPHGPGEQPLGASAASYWSLFDHMQEGLAHCRMEFFDGRPVDWTYLSVNPAFEELTGLHLAAGRRVSELIPGIAESNPDLFEIYGRVAAGAPPERFESWVPGLERWFEITVYSPAHGEFVAVFDVINQRKRAEEALRASEARYAELVRGLPVGVFTIRLHPGEPGRFEYVSPRTSWILGIDPEPLLRDASTLGDAFHPDDRDRVMESWEESLSSPETSHCEGRVVARGETRRIRIESEPTVMPDGTIVRHGIVEDTTDRG